MLDDEESRKKPTEHTVGCDLEPFSVHELAARIELLREEIVRLEVEMQAKKGSLSAAEALFKT